MVEVREEEPRVQPRALLAYLATQCCQPVTYSRNSEFILIKELPVVPLLFISDHVFFKLYQMGI